MYIHHWKKKKKPAYSYPTTFTTCHVWSQFSASADVISSLSIDESWESLAPPLKQIYVGVTDAPSVGGNYDKGDGGDPVRAVLRKELHTR